MEYFGRSFGNESSINHLGVGIAGDRVGRGSEGEEGEEGELCLLLLKKKTAGWWNQEFAEGTVMGQAGRF